MKKSHMCLSFCLFTFLFCTPSFVSHAEYVGESDVVHNNFSIAIKKDHEADIDWVDTISIQWCEYPYDIDEGSGGPYSLNRLDTDEEEETVLKKPMSKDEGLGGAENGVASEVVSEDEVVENVVSERDSEPDKDGVSGDSLEDSDTKSDEDKGDLDVAGKDAEEEEVKSGSDKGNTEETSNTDNVAIPEKTVKVKDNIEADKRKDSNETNDKEVDLDE